MKGDFSRWTFDRKKHYNTVLKQQGRVEVEADSNEQAAIDIHRMRVTSQDVIGPCGVPRVLGSPDPGGFRVALKSLALHGVRFAGTTGLLVGESGLTLSTLDGGKTWRQEVLPGAAAPTLRGIGLDGEALVAVVGDRGTLMLGDMEGREWRRVETGVEQDLHSISLVSGVCGWTVGEDGLILFYDGNKTHKQNSGVSVSLRGASFAENGPGFVVGASGTVLVSENYGKKWTKLETETDANLHAVCCVGGEQGLCWAVGENGAILRIVRNGNDWAVDSHFSDLSLPGLRAVHFQSQSLGWAVGEKGTVLVWNGETWRPWPSGTIEELTGVWSAGGKNVWAVGNAGTVIHSEDAGTQWKRVEVLATELTLAPGRIYVHGRLCESEQVVRYESQPDYWPDALVPPPAEERPRTDLVFLHVLDRHITALEDPGLREPALGGPDTATRIKTVWRAEIRPGPGQAQKDILAGTLEAVQLDLANLAEIIGSGSAAPVDQLITRIETNGKVVARAMEKRGGADQKLGRALLDPAAALKSRGKVSVARVLKVAELLNRYREQIAEPETEVPCCTRPPEWAPATGTLCARTRPSEGDRPCLMRPDAGYSLLENQLYRVEVHSAGELGTATFIWSRDNGSVAVSIDQVEGQTIHVRHTGSDRVLGFAEGHWVEVTDDRMELDNHAGQLVKVAHVDHDGRKVEIDSATQVPAVEQGRHPLLRRWDSPGSVLVEVPGTNEGWIRLEGGIEVRFGPGTYKAGDYWLIPARTATGGIEWPEDANGDPKEMPPLGIEHHYCPLALLEWKKEGGVEVKDCRRFFYPLATPALHVVRTSWRNDSDVELDTMGSAGLKITFDGAPRADTVSAATVIVRMEVPRSGTAETAGSLLEELIVTGDVSVPEGDPDAIVWKPAGTDDILPLLKVYKRCRVRLELKGHSIWSEACGLRVYLDGQTFGCPTKKPDDSYGTDLVFPSGRGDQASNFESWFWVLLSGSPTPSSQTMFVDESGAQVSSYLEGDRLYVKVVDPSHAGATSLANAVTIGTQAYGLTPLAGATNDTFITTGLDLNLAAGAAVTATYKDPRDPTDTSSDTVTILARKRSERVPRARGDVEPEGRAAN
jgi:photosystem II stability/assembly factor-like uncharacterized protein